MQDRQDLTEFDKEDVMKMIQCCWDATEERLLVRVCKIAGRKIKVKSGLNTARRR